MFFVFLPAERRTKDITKIFVKCFYPNENLALTFLAVLNVVLILLINKAG